MFYLETLPGRTCKIDGKDFLFFSGYSYLGMNHVSTFIDLVKKGIDEFGLLFPSSRISNSRLKLFEDFENVLSQLTQRESTVSFSSGYLAGQTIADILSTYKNIFIAPNTHPAIKIKGITDASSENFKSWADEVSVAINNSPEKKFILIADSINIMESIINDFSFLENIAPSKKIIFLIDDSHGIGLLGNKGEGIISRLPKKENYSNIEYIISYSLSKAFNIGGGAVSCSQYFSDLLRQHPNYMASTSINPSHLYAFINSQHLYNDQREKLRQNISLVKKSNDKIFHKNESGLPIFIAKENSADLFFKNDIIISSFGYPTLQSKTIDRAIINALHTNVDIKKLLSTSL